MRTSLHIVVCLVLAGAVMACSSDPLGAEVEQVAAAEPDPGVARQSLAPSAAATDVVVTPTPVAWFGRPCLDGSVEQTFTNGLVGCAGRVVWADRSAACGLGYRPATAREWNAHRGTVAPTHNYWTDDPLRYQGTAASCSVDRYVGSSCGSEPMRVCTTSGADAEGNACNWRNCGFQTAGENDYFGGCTSNPTAGTLCVPITAAGAVAGGSCRDVFAEYIQWVQSGNYVELTGTSIQAQSSGAGLVSYIRGTLQDLLTPAASARRIRGSLIKQSFNDRLAAGGQPFNIAARDDLSIELDEQGDLHIILDSWGSGRMTATPVACAQEIAYGFSENGTLWGFVLAKRVTPG